MRDPVRSLGLAEERIEQRDTAVAIAEGELRDAAALGDLPPRPDGAGAGRRERECVFETLSVDGGTDEGGALLDRRVLTGDREDGKTEVERSRLARRRIIAWSSRDARGGGPRRLRA